MAAAVEKSSVIVAATVLARVELIAAGPYAAIRQDADAARSSPQARSAS